MKNISCPNSGKTSRTHFKLGKEVYHASGITCHDFKVKVKGQGHTTT